MGKIIWRHFVAIKMISSNKIASFGAKNLEIVFFQLKMALLLIFGDYELIRCLLTEGA